MSDHPTWLPELHDLFDRLQDGNFSENDRLRLNELLAAGAEQRRCFTSYLDIHSWLAWEGIEKKTLGVKLPWESQSAECGTQNGATNAECETTSEELLALSIAPCEDAGIRGSSIISRRSPSILQPLSSPLLPLFPTALSGTVGYLSSGWPVAYMIATVICGVSLLVGSHVYVSQPEQIAQRSSVPSRVAAEPKTELVGRITGMADCKWAGAAADSPGVPLGRKYELASGLMEITYDSGAKVILQGPVAYEVESKNGGFLSVGKLTARVAKKPDGSNPQSLIPNPLLSTIHYSLFTIKTPTATVTDLGTEFGVEVNKAGLTTSHVFRGSVRLEVATFNGGRKAAARVLHENESARVEKNGSNEGGGNVVIVFVAPAKPADFVRKIVKPTIKTLDLVDVVAGGDGFSGRRGRGIDPTNGQLVDTPMKDATGKQSREIDVPSDGRYHRVEGLPYVDGVFIPDSRKGSVQLDSAGHAFAEFGNASYTTASNVWAGGAVPAVPSERIPSIRTTLGGIDYASPGHGLLFLHANKGITFDMQAMRQANPDQRLVRFRAMVGNTEIDSDRGFDVCADVCVFVDGEVRFRHRQINSSHGALTVAVPINPKDRFLTLVATDGGNGISSDWILFGDPRLELVPATPAKKIGKVEP